MINCKHAVNIKRQDSVVCNLGLYGGRPSFGICQACDKRQEDPDFEKRAPAPFDIRRHRVAPAIAARAAKNLAVCQSCNHYRSSCGVFVHCNKCQCEKLPAWVTGRCPIKKWELAASTATIVKALQYVRPDGGFTQLANLYRGQSAFLLCGGPSLNGLQLEMLEQPGILSMAINNTAKLVRPTLWIGTDKYDRWLPSILDDPRVLKFIPWRRRIEHLDRSAIFGFVEKQPLRWWDFFSQDRVIWEKSTMLSAIRILFDLGIRRIFLLGADFDMTEGQGYATDDEVEKGHATRNNKIYQMLADQFEMLVPLFMSVGLHIYNCNPESRLTTFPFLGYNQAVSSVLATFGHDPAAEQTSGGVYQCPSGTTDPA